VFAGLIGGVRIQLGGELQALLTYHDPCYLGRHNGVYGEPRRVLDAVPGLQTVEMPRHHERALCCGAGGARMWMEEHLGKRINSERTEEAISTGAARMGVSCPFCYIMLDDGAKAAGERIEGSDISELVSGTMARTAPI